ncbi:MAG TPA: hypothetical protein VK569_02185, partial [Bacteroidota bacterium]|nr:hypothetical protein [Bacteroidota bacterium]
LRDAFAVFRPPGVRDIDSLMHVIEDTRLARFTDPTKKAGGGRAVLTWDTGMAILPMYAVFLFVFFTVMVLTYFAARALAVWNFIRWKQGRASALRLYLATVESKGFPGAVARADLPVRAAFKGLASLLLFAPAYVIAYSFRTSLDTGSVLFLVPLAVVSNGVLVNYANHLYALLVAESRKGYVQTAIVKGLDSAYAWDAPGGLRRQVLLAPALGARNHVFREIYRNARLQFIPSMKEHAAFVVTGIVIIEMALNIKGYLCYALLQHLLYREFDIAIAIVFAIFLTVKLTEVCVDLWHGLETRRYDNAG